LPASSNLVRMAAKTKSLLPLAYLSVMRFKSASERISTKTIWRRCVTSDSSWLIVVTPRAYVSQRSMRLRQSRRIASTGAPLPTPSCPPRSRISGAASRRFIRFPGIPFSSSAPRSRPPKNSSLPARRGSRWCDEQDEATDERSGFPRQRPRLLHLCSCGDSRGECGRTGKRPRTRKKKLWRNCGDRLRRNRKGLTTNRRKSLCCKVPETGLEPARSVKITRPSTCPSPYLPCDELVGQMQGNRLSVNAFGLTRYRTYIVAAGALDGQDSGKKVATTGPRLVDSSPLPLFATFATIHARSQATRPTTTNHALGPPSLKAKSFRSGRTS
jgi:hypothetical protein